MKASRLLKKGHNPPFPDCTKETFNNRFPPPKIVQGDTLIRQMSLVGTLAHRQMEGVASKLLFQKRDGGDRLRSLLGLFGKITGNDLPLLLGSAAVPYPTLLGQHFRES